MPSSALFRFCRADAQALNAYCDDLASGRLPPEARLSFFVRDTAAAAQSDGGLRRIEATLPARGSLAPLLHAFGLLSDTELQQEEQQGRPGGRLDRETIDYAFLADRSRRISAMQMLSRRGCGQAGCGAAVLHVRTAIAHHQHRRWLQKPSGEDLKLATRPRKCAPCRHSRANSNIQSFKAGGQDRSLVVWLHDMVAEAVRAAEEAEGMTAAVRQQQLAIRRTYQLTELQVLHCMSLDRRLLESHPRCQSTVPQRTCRRQTKRMSVLCSLMGF